ncbi:MAG: hypothetical protein IT379_01950 [Deltaproteobacteria bacterium]|nr:hypothetical protein [Deltaproteobacteria bacterium]
MTLDVLRSEELESALAAALSGRSARLADLLARHGGLPGPRPNLALASAFGNSLARAGTQARPLLDALVRAGSAADEARTFLPIAAAFGFAARLSTDDVHAWDGIFELAADDRAAVRTGLIAALGGWAARTNLGPLVARAARWLEHPDREHRFAACAIVLDVIAERRRLETLEDRAALLSWMERVIGEIADAPRAAERSPARRRILAALPSALAEIAVSLRDEGERWLIAQLSEARHPDVRIAMEQAIDALRKGARARSSSVIEAMRAALASSAKPSREAARIRHGMSGRGKKGDRRSR